MVHWIWLVMAVFVAIGAGFSGCAYYAISRLQEYEEVIKNLQKQNINLIKKIKDRHE